MRNPNDQGLLWQRTRELTYASIFRYTAVPACEGKWLLIIFADRERLNNFVVSNFIPGTRGSVYLARLRHYIQNRSCDWNHLIGRESIVSASSSKMGFREIWGSKRSVLSVSVQISLLYFSGSHLVAVRLVLNCMCPATLGDDQLLQLPSRLFYFAPVPWVENQASNSPLPHTLSRIIKNISWPHDLYNHYRCRMVVKLHSHLISQNLALHLHCVIIWIIVMLLNPQDYQYPKEFIFSLLEFVLHCVPELQFNVLCLGVNSGINCYIIQGPSVDQVAHSNRII